MASIGRNIKTKGVIMALLTLVLMNIGCEDKIDNPAVNPSEGKTVEVTLDLGLADEADGYTLSAPSATKSSVAAFSYELQPAVATKGAVNSLKPDQLYNLEIQQYDQSGIRIGGMSSAIPDQPIGSKLNLTLTKYSDCQLVIVAWGKERTTRLGANNDLTAAQDISVAANTITNLNPESQSDMNKMPYVLHLEHVCVENTIKSIEGEDKDVRLLLRRLATRLTLDWSYLYSGYALNQILLQSIPIDYKVVAAPDKTDRTYPSLLDQFTTIQLTSSEIAAGKYACWIPANVRGKNPAATSQTYRIKSNAPIGSSYIDFIASNQSDVKKKLSYRVYLGGSEYSDFNLYGNTDYNYTVTIKHTALPVNDRRVTIIDPISASENNNNLVPTANCFMVVPGGAFCFDPYSYYLDGSNIKNQYLTGGLDSWCNEGDITSVRLLWQTKDGGNVGDPAMGVVTSDADHSNIVELKNGRIYCRVAPNTKGGSGVIAAYNAENKIVWSWHIWVTDYAPSALGTETVLTENKRKFVLTNGTQKQLPIMDRNLGAYDGYMEIPGSITLMSRANGFHYYAKRKDPFPSSYTSRKLKAEFKFTPEPDRPPRDVLARFKADGITWIIPSTTTSSAIKDVYQDPLSYGTINSTSWGATKTLHDPCPAGWKIPSKEQLQLLVDYNQSIPANIEEQGGILLKYDNTDYRTYLRLSGYVVGTRQLNNVGYSGYIMTWTNSKGSSQVFTVSRGNAVAGDSKGIRFTSKYFGDTHSTRCIQERE